MVQPSVRVSPQWHDPPREGACLTVNDVGEPCAREPHARFERGPLAKRTLKARPKRAPDGKPPGLSPAAYKRTTSQRPTSRRVWHMLSAGWVVAVKPPRVGVLGRPGTGVPGGELSSHG